MQFTVATVVVTVTVTGTVVSVFVWLMFISFFLLLSLTYRFSDYYFVCAIGGQHDGHLPFWLPSFVKLIMLLLHVLFAC